MFLSIIFSLLYVIKKMRSLSCGPLTPLTGAKLAFSPVTTKFFAKKLPFLPIFTPQSACTPLPITKNLDNREKEAGFRRSQVGLRRAETAFRNDETPL
jgi:hypothetical protein